MDDPIYTNVAAVRRAYEGVVPDSGPVFNRVEYLIEEASARLTALVPSLPDRIAVGEVSKVVASGVIVRTVLRALRNPTEAMTHSQTAGPYGNTVSFGAAATAANRAFFDPEDLELLAPPTPLGLRSVPMGIPGWRVP